MKKLIFIALFFALISTIACADVQLYFQFDNNAADRGLWADGVKQNISFSGGYTGTETDFNNLDGVDEAVNFSVAGLSIGTFSGTITPGGGRLMMGASGGGIDAVGTDSDYFDDASEYWELTLNKDIILKEVDYYAPDASQQVLTIAGSAVNGSPFSDDITGVNIEVSSGQTIRFGYDSSGTGSYGIADFTIEAIPEPSTLTLVAVIGLVAILRRKLHG